MQNEIKVKGFKAMEPDMTCRGFQFELGKTYKHNGKVKPCNSGFHFCKKIEDIEGYYPVNCRIFEVEASGVIVEDDDKTVTDTLTIVKEIDYNAYIDHSNPWVRAVVASQGVGLDTLINDEYNFVRAEVAKQGYGLDKLVEDESWRVRAGVASTGYGLDILLHDPDLDVRCEVAKQGYGLDVLVRDWSVGVRHEVAKHGYGLDILVNDEYISVRDEARKRLKELRNGK